jgi:hypothetical protein
MHSGEADLSEQIEDVLYEESSTNPPTKVDATCPSLSTPGLFASIDSASIDRSDANHRSCLDLLSRSREELVLPSPVLVELDQFIWTRRRHR